MKRLPVAVAAVLVATATLAATAPAVAGTPSYRPAPLSWHDCHAANTPPRLQCATLRVPLDWSEPAGEKINIALDRLPATDPQHRIGPLLINPGGPGGSGVDVVSYGGALAEPEYKALQQRFDVIGFDPRGVGHSTPVRCAKPVYDSTVPTFPTDERQYRQLVDSNRTHGAGCAKQTGPLIRHVDTVSAARDIEAIRIGLGVPTISWLGISYGTELGATYAELFPGHVRAMVLDGAVDHSRGTAQDAVDESTVIEDEFGRFVSWCQRTATCALRGHDIAADFDALTARADRGGITDPKLKRTVSGAELTNASYSFLTEPASWPDLATGLATAGKTPSDPSGLISAALFNYPQIYTPYRAVGCHDFPSGLHGLADLRTRAARVKAVAPHMWRYSEIWDWTTGCAGWPVPAANPPRRQHVTGAPAILVVNNTHDPSTPYVWAKGLAGQIQGSRLLTVRSDGHTAMMNSACGRTRENDYLISAKVPPPGTSCPS